MGSSPNPGPPGSEAIEDLFREPAEGSFGNAAEIGKLAGLWRYWRDKAGDRPMPTRGDLDPAEITDLLPNILLVDVLRDPLDFRYRLIGTEIDYHSERGYTGQKVSEIPHRAPPSTVWDNLTGIARDGEASRRVIPYVGPHKLFTETRQLMCPLSGDGATVDMIVGAVVYLTRPR